MLLKPNGSETKRRDLVAWWLVDNETDALHLALVVEANDPDECAGVFLLGLLDLLDHLRRVCAAVHGQLPHGPVAPIVVPWWLVVLTVHESMLQPPIYILFKIPSSTQKLFILKKRTLPPARTQCRGSTQTGSGSQFPSTTEFRSYQAGTTESRTSSFQVEATPVFFVFFPPNIQLIKSKKKCVLVEELCAYLHALNSPAVVGEGGDVVGLAGDGEGGGGFEASEGCHHTSLSRGGAVDGGNGRGWDNWGGSHLPLLLITRSC